MGCVFPYQDEIVPIKYSDCCYFTYFTYFTLRTLDSCFLLAFLLQDDGGGMLTGNFPVNGTLHFELFHYPYFLKSEEF